jgi:hypothetical protein
MIAYLAFTLLENLELYGKFPKLYRKYVIFPHQWWENINGLSMPLSSWVLVIKTNYIFLIWIKDQVRLMFWTKTRFGTILGYFLLTYEIDSKFYEKHENQDFLKCLISNRWALELEIHLETGNCYLGVSDWR